MPFMQLVHTKKTICLYRFSARSVTLRISLRKKFFLFHVYIYFCLFQIYYYEKSHLFKYATIYFFHNADNVTRDIVPDS